MSIDLWTHTAGVRHRSDGHTSGVRQGSYQHTPQVYEIDLIEPYTKTAPDIHMRIACGGGTYVQSIGRDLGRALGSAAHMTALTRTKHGEFALPDCVAHEDAGNVDVILAAMRANDATFTRLVGPGGEGGEGAGHAERRGDGRSNAPVAVECKFCSQVWQMFHFVSSGCARALALIPPRIFP